MSILCVVCVSIVFVVCVSILFVGQYCVLFVCHYCLCVHIVCVSVLSVCDCVNDYLCVNVGVIVCVGCGCNWGLGGHECVCEGEGSPHHLWVWAAVWAAVSC